MRKLILFLLASIAVRAQALPNAVPMPTPEIQFLDQNGKPLAGAKLCSYAAGSSTPQATYTDSSAGTPNTNPIVLDVSGRASVWVGPQLYKFVLLVGGDDDTCDTGAIQWTQDNVSDTTLYFANYVKTAGTCTLISFTATGTGAVARSCSSKLGDQISIKDYGAVCDGATDDSAAVARVIALAPATALIPAGTCRLASNETFPSNMPVEFLGMLSPDSGKVVALNGGVVASEAQQIQDGAGAFAFGAGSVYSVSERWFAGSDCGARINSAYASLPAGGGIVDVMGACSFSTPIVFGTNNKPAILRGQGDVTNLTYTGTGTAVTLNYGTGLRMGHGIRDLTLTGPGNSSSTTGVVVGGTNGAQGFDIRDSKIQSFGINVTLASNSWVGTFTHDMIRDGGTNVLFPGDLTLAGENIQFLHTVFADAPSPHTNSVWIQGGGQEVDFTDCSFDQAQLRIGDGSSSAAQVNLKGNHFENPNYASGVDYPFIVVDNNNGNDLAMSQNFFEQDRTAGGAYASFISLNGGKASLVSTRMFSPVQTTNFITLANAANVDLFSFNDLSGNTVALLGGSTTGQVTSFPGANTAATVGFNNLITVGDPVGGALLDVKGAVRAASHQLITTIPTGTAPLAINSTTPVTNLFANPTTYGAGGTQNTNTLHLVTGAAALSGGSATVTLIGSAGYANSSSYFCTANDTSGTNPVQVAPSSGITFTLHGTGSDNVSYVCVGN